MRVLCTTREARICCSELMVKNRIELSKVMPHWAITFSILLRWPGSQSGQPTYMT